MSVLHTITDGISNAFLMAWAVWWALVLGFAISAAIQTFVPRQRIERALGAEGLRPVALATAMGAASSSCSYAAIAIARSLFAMGASAMSALAFQFASTNLVVELGIVIWVLIGWQFTLAELLGGLILTACMSLLLRFFVSERLERQAREHARAAEPGHQHDSHGHQHGSHGDQQSTAADRSAGDRAPVRKRLTSREVWSEVAGHFRDDWAMLYREITIGFLLAGFIGLLGDGFFNGLFIVHAPPALRLVENVLVGPLIAMASFVCSVGNVPLAAVLWSGGISFAGVIAFIFADLIVLPIVAVYRKYYGTPFAIRIVALMFVTIVIAALVTDGLISAAGLVPHLRPTRADIFSGVSVDYTLFMNVLAAAVFAALFALTMRPRSAR
jgi:uncharacterized membrane protein YraQ (UPF0718 family)